MSGSPLASVVFLKIQEFARRPVSEQARLRAQLEAVVAVTAAELDPASRVVLEAGDGAAIVVLSDPHGALRLAQRALSACAAGLPLAAGLNHGAVQLTGRKDGAGLIGDGIAVAAAAAEFASPARLLASRAFRDALAEAAPGVEASLVKAGTFTDPGLRAHELYRPDPEAAQRRAGRYALAGAAVAIALVAGGLAARIALEGQQPFMEAVVAKYRSTAERGEGYWRALVHKVGF